jgi:HAD superfamily hydrolase (TIGR01509 family)
MSRQVRHRHDPEGASDIGARLAGKSVLIFDFDGTIAETTPLHARAFEETLAPFGVAIDYPSIAGLKTQDAISRCLATEGRREEDFDLPTLVAEKQRRARELIAEQLAPIPGVETFLVRARSRYRMALVTSGSRGTVALALRKLGYEKWFDPIICAEDVARAKPAPDGFLKALAALRARPEQALVFEDAESGFEAARAAGLGVVDVRTLDWSSAVANI